MEPTPDQEVAPAPDPQPPISPDTSALMTDLLAEIRGVRRELADALALRAGTEERSGPEMPDEALAVLRVDLADALEAVRDRLVGTITEMSEATRTGLASTASGVEEAVRGLRETLLDRLEEQHSAVRMRLAEAAAQTQAGTAATRHTQERLAALVTSNEQLRRAVAALQSTQDRAPGDVELPVGSVGQPAEAVAEPVAAPPQAEETATPPEPEEAAAAAPPTWERSFVQAAPRASRRPGPRWRRG